MKTLLGAYQMSNLLSTRVFNFAKPGIDSNPILKLRTVSAYTSPGGAVTPIYGYYGVDPDGNTYLDTPRRRTVSFSRDSIETTGMASGVTNNWNRHFWLSGTIEWDKITWRAAQVLMRAFEFERSSAGAEPTDWDSILLLKVFGKGDPYWLDVTISNNNLEFPGLGNKINIGHSASISWKASVAWDERKGDDDAGLAAPSSIIDFWYAHYDDEYVTWE